MKEDKDWEVECMANKIKEVEMCKKEKPDLYKKAMKKLGMEAKTIMSFADIKELKEDMSDDEEKEDGDD